jgi:NTE family protein
MRKRELMSRVTYLSTVSGGSFTGAWWALHHDDVSSWRGLPDLLARGFEAQLVPGTFKEPADRTHVAAELYDRELFGGSRFRDLPDGPPYLIINATDMVLGRRFPFTQEQLGCIGSDLGALPIGYAVAASAAFPVAFSPGRFENYGASHEDCFLPFEWERLGATPPAEHPLPRPASSASDPVDYWDLVARQRYADQVNLARLYLSDGGIADNLGLQAFVALTPKLERAFQAGQLQSIAFVFVDAVAAPVLSYGKETAPPNIVQVISRMADLFLQSTSRSTQDETRALARRIRTDLRAVELTPRVGCVRISFDDVLDDGLRRTLNDTATRLTLQPAEVRTLVRAGEYAAARKLDRIDETIRSAEDPTCQ